MNSSSGAMFSLSSRGKYKKPSVKYVLGWSHGKNCCNTYVNNVLVQTESFYSMQKAYFIRKLGELLLRGKGFNKFHGGTICYPP